jgi:hypothetical protein
MQSDRVQRKHVIMRITNKQRSMRSKLSLCLLLWAAAVGLHAQSTSQQAGTVPAINADLGSCSVLFTVKDGTGKAVPGATLRVRIAYGFMGIRKLDLETSTNNDGKARFQGMPSDLKRALFFHASKDKLVGTAFYDAAKNCDAEHTIVMMPKKDEPDAANPGDQTEEQK